MHTVNTQLNKSAGDSAPVISSTAPTDTNNAPVARPPLVLVQRDGAVTIRDLIDRYMREYAGRDTTRVQRLAFWSDQLGSIALSELDDDHIFRALDALAATRGRYFAGLDANGARIFKAKRNPMKPATINRYSAALGAVLTWSIKKRIAPRDFTNPCKRIERAPECNEIVRYLSDTERAALLIECKRSTWSKLYVFVLLALTCGGRRGELEALRWSDIDFERGEATVARSKNGDRKTLILVPTVLEELVRFRGADVALAFASTRRPDVPFNHVEAWRKALKNAGIKNFRFHDLRHSCASALAQSGASLLEIADVLGHRNLSVTKRYSHLATTHKAKLINRVLGGFR